MADKQVLIPGPDHPITVEPTGERVVVRFGDTVIADTTSALTLQEASYPAVQYIPRGDVDMSHLRRTDNESYCPFKGDANYFSIDADGRTAENVIWTYEAPHDAVSEIKDHVAFYANKVTFSAS